ncbi:unnamed protein product [Sympodiomycopsis kandeliae]
MASSQDAPSLPSLTQPSSYSASSLPPGLALSISRVLDSPDSTQQQQQQQKQKQQDDPNGTITIANHNVPSQQSETLTQRLARQFADPESVTSTSIQRRQAQLRKQLVGVDAELDQLLNYLKREQASSKLAESSSIQIAIKKLFDQLETIRTKATSSESTVREITGDIRTLDTAKNNLVASITSLKRLQMLEAGATRLQELTDQNNFREAAQALQAAKSLQQSFQSYMTVDRVAAVWRQINQSQQQLKAAAMEQYEKFFLRDTASPAIRSTSVPDAAVALDAIGPHAVTSLLDWYCSLQLREYRRIFRATDEAGQLDNVGRRFAWFRRVVKQHEEQHASGFLPAWETATALTGRFSDVTRDDLKSVLIREKQKPQVNVLLEALGATMEYEQQTSKRLGKPFAEIMTANPKPVTAAAAVPSGISVATTQGPASNISSVFEPYLGLYVESQDKALSELMSNYRRQGATIPRPSGEQGDSSTSAAPAEQQHHTVLPSSTELFYFYRQTLEQCARLSNREPLRDLFLVFRRYLQLYVDEVLRTALFRQDSGGRRSTSTDTRLNIQDVQKWCLVLNTAEYCANTCQQLEQKLSEKIHEDFKQVVTLEQEREGFLAVVSATVQVFTRETEFSLDTGFHKMMRPTIPWSQVVEVHGKSEYTDDLASGLEAVAVIIRQDVQNKRYVRSWCDKVVNIVTTKFINIIVRLRPLHRTSCEQLMIDLYELRNTLLDLPQFSPSESVSASGSSYTRMLDKQISRIESLLRIVMVPTTDSTEGGDIQFIQEYINLIGDSSFSNFQKVLELKGLKRSEMNTLIEHFVQYTNSHTQEQQQSNTGSGGGNTFLTTLDMDPPMGIMTPAPILESQATPSSYLVRNSSSTGVRSPDRAGALSPSNDGVTNRVFGSGGKFSNIFGGLARRGLTDSDTNTRR